ncbi:MAG TPA: 3'(2'),5'-bisphosphate nucleotidase CysQ [Xanthobacteraceae bacterium]|nr:3'(2'),5'-bisphosphate nucleotidase CysQ [Xanthobacteraceae bacterium]
MSGQDRGRLLAALAALASEAGAGIARAAEQGLAPRDKGDKGPVTAADEASEEILRAGLARLLPGVPIVSEEAFDRGEVAEAATEFLLVDPLDGTRELVAGRPEYAINIALIAGGAPLLGVLYAPAYGQLYGGADGQAFKAPLSLGAPFDPERAETIRARPRPKQLVAALSRSHLDPASEAFLAGHAVERRIVLGSALKFALIAEGIADVYPRLAPVREWDVAAGHALITAAGGRVERRDGGTLRYGRRDAGFLVEGFVAWGAPPAA